jgi:hypothetical protein
MRLKNLLSAMAVAALAATAAAPASAQTVDQAVKALTAAIRELREADNYFLGDGPPGSPSILSGLVAYSDSLSGLTAEQQRKTINKFFSEDTREQSARMLRRVRANVVEVTAPEGGAAYLRDVFYLDFVGQFRNVFGEGDLSITLRRFFGRTAANSLLERYELAVSRTR